MSAEPVIPPPSKGLLAYNASQVAMLQSCLSTLDSSFDVLPGLIKKIDAGNCWMDFKFPDAPTVHWSASEFRQFVQAPRPDGCDTPLYILERALRGTDAWEPFLDLTRGKRGGQSGNTNAVAAQPNREDETKCDAITLRSVPSVIPFDPPHRLEPKPAPKPKPATGTSVSYAIRRLKENRPELASRVISGELSAHAASVQAGFQERKVTVPVHAARAARILVRHFSPEDIKALIAELSIAVGTPLSNDGGPT